MTWALAMVLFAGRPGGTAGTHHGDPARLQGTWPVVAMQENCGPIHDNGGELDDEQFFRALDFCFMFDGDRLVPTGNFQGFGEPGGRDPIVTPTIDRRRAQRR